MVLIKLKCPPEDLQATMNVRITTNKPQLSLSSLKARGCNPVLEVLVNLRCTSSTQPSRAITIFTPETIFNANHDPDDGNMDNLARGMLGGGLTCTSNPKKRISFGYFKIHRVSQENANAADLRDRPGANFLTVPALDSGKEVTVKYSLTGERIFVFADGMSADDLALGEKYSIGLNDGYVGATWWCWGDLDEELRDKKMHAFAKDTIGLWHGDEPNVSALEDEGWVVGEKRAQLEFITNEGDGSCDVEIVE